MRKIRFLAICVLLAGVVSIAIGATFIAEGMGKNNYMKDAMRQEQITIGLGHEGQESDDIVDSGGEAQAAGDLVREHRHSIAATYGDLLGEDRFDPTNPDHLTYAQALNLENYLYLAVTGFGLTTVVIISGIVMIVTGLALGGTGVVLFVVTRKDARV